MEYQLSGFTGTAAPPRRCNYCGKPEHGSIGCEMASNWSEPESKPVCLACKGTGFVSAPCPKCHITYRVMNDELFRIDPGSPPGRGGRRETS